MTEWQYAVGFAVKRSRQSDTGAIAAAEGILGYECSQTSSKALRVYEAAQKARETQQRALEGRRQRLMPVGCTGIPDADRELRSKLRVPEAATA